jgi:hypothetical protein
LGSTAVIFNAIAIPKLNITPKREGFKMKAHLQHYCVVTLIALICLTPLVNSLHAQSELMANWTFNNTSADASGHGFDATLEGNAGYTDDAVKGSHSLLLNGSPDYAYVGPMDLGDQFTICAWVFLELDQSNIQTIIGNAMGGSTVDGFKLFINNWETNNKCILIETSDGSARLDATSPENTFEEGFWNHVAATLDVANGVAEIFYNGEDVTQSGSIVTNFQTTQAVTIGSMSGPDWYLTGMIDDVRIYQGLLTIDEIADVMDSPETGIQSKEAIITDYQLSNFPNPFNPSTTITFNIPQAQPFELDIVNIHGERIRLLAVDKNYFGPYHILWDGLDDLGRVVPSGIYVCRLRGDNLKQSRKMLLVR